MEKKSRKTPKNEKHVDLVWGNNGRQKIKIPTVIDDYNHWMGDVDLADQRISYYHPNLRSYRNWIPMFLQIISLVRNNSYLVYRANTEKPVSHKEFTLNMVETLLLQVEFFHDNPELPTDVIGSTDGSPQSQLSLSQKSTNTAQNATSSVASSHCSARSLSSMPRSFP